MKLRKDIFFLFLMFCFIVLVTPAVICSAEEKNGITIEEKNKTLYLGGCKGKTSEGEEAEYYSYLNVRNLIKGFSSKKHDIKLQSKNKNIATTSSKKDRIYARGIGKAKIKVKVRSVTDGTLLFKGYLRITVKKNADPEIFKVEGLTDGMTVYDGDTVTVTMSGEYTDERTIECDDESVEITKSDDKSIFYVKFTEPGIFDITAAAFQSIKYNAYTASKVFEICVKERKAEVTQLSSDMLMFKGGPVDEDLSCDEISVYEIQNGVEVFYSYASDIEIEDNEARIRLFKSLNSCTGYVLEYDGLKFEFISGASEITDVASIDIVEDSIDAGENKELSFKYFNSDGLDITSAVKKKLDPKIILSIADRENEFLAYVNGRKLCIIESGHEVTVEALLDTGTEPGEAGGRLISVKKVIKALPKRSEIFSGNMIYTFKVPDGKYLTWEDKCYHSAPKGDNIVLEVLFEMGDGSTKNLKQAGVTLVVADMKVVMLGKETLNGGYGLILNHEGTTQIVAVKDEKPVGVFDITVQPQRKPAVIKVELSKDHLNTNYLMDDYIIIKADLFDQYGSPVTDSKFNVTQTEISKRSAGAVNFNKMSEGRFLVYGYECMADKTQNVVSGTITSGDLSSDFKFYIRDIQYDPKYTGYSYELEADGSKLINSGTGLGSEPPKSTFVTTKITLDGYSVGEGIGMLFDERPSARNNAEYYGVSPNECIYGMSVEYTPDMGDTVFLDLYGQDCIIPSYMDIEFAPYVYGAKLPEGEYKVTVYKIITGEKISQPEECDSVSIRVIDADPEVEVIQTAQTYSSKISDWKNSITKFFKFMYDGEDISKYITKVDCVEAPSGSVFVRSVDFMIPNPYFGLFTKTVLIERLITKQ